jgi:hypothetical protein
LQAAKTVADECDLPTDWLNSQVSALNILPDGWHTRRVFVGQFGPLAVCACSRQDLLATKFHAGRPRDLGDIQAMAPTREELSFVRTYLTMLRVPSRQANLDQVARALKLLDAFEEDADD